MGCVSSVQPEQHEEQSIRIYQTIIIGSTFKGPLILNIQTNRIMQIKTLFKIPKYSNALLISPNEGYITGGIQQLQEYIEGQKQFNSLQAKKIFQGTVLKTFYRINISILKKGLQQAFVKLPDMINDRYAHASILFNHKLYIIGGRQYGQDQTGLLNACQRFDFMKNQWQIIPPLKKRRSSSFCVIFNDCLYVFGGYTGKNKRSRRIQTYKEGYQQWKQLNVKMHMGIEGGIIVPYQKYGLYIFGGKTNTGYSNQVTYFNLQDLTIDIKPSMKQKRFFHKYIKKQSRIILIGGGVQDIQMYDLKVYTTDILKQISFLDYCSVKDLNSLSQFQQSIQLESQLKIKQNKLLLSGEKLYLYMIGHGKQPFVKIFNFNNNKIIKKAQKLSFAFYQFRTSLRVNKQYIFIMGGINSNYSNVTNHAISYHILTENIKTIQNMINQRYGFPAIVKGSYAYVFGGRKLGADDSAIMNQCQRFSFQKEKWQSIAPMKYRRHSSICLIVTNYIVILSGYNGNGKLSNQIELYSDSSNNWIQLDQKFQLNIQAISVVNYESQIYLFGGRTDEGDINRVFSLKINIKSENLQKIEKLFTLSLKPIGNLSFAGSNLRIFMKKHIAYIFGNKSKSIDIFDLKKCASIKEDDTVLAFESELKTLNDEYLKSYTIFY